MTTVPDQENGDDSVPEFEPPTEEEIEEAENDPGFLDPIEDDLVAFRCQTLRFRQQTRSAPSMSSGAAALRRQIPSLP